MARFGAAFAYGLPGPVLTVAMVVEITAGTGFFLWHAFDLRRSGLAAVVQPAPA